MFHLSLPSPQPGPRGTQPPGVHDEVSQAGGGSQGGRGRDIRGGQDLQLPAGGEAGHLHQHEARLLPQQAVQAGVLPAGEQVHQQ